MGDLETLFARLELEGDARISNPGVVIECGESNLEELLIVQIRALISSINATCDDVNGQLEAIYAHLGTHKEFVLLLQCCEVNIEHGSQNSNIFLEPVLSSLFSNVIHDDTSLALCIL